MILTVIGIYFAVILIISYFAGRKPANNEAFFMADRKSPWYIVAIGMLGDSISGVTFVSVPGMVGVLDMTYMQLVLGFFAGYLAVTYLLLPLYYRLNLVSIYSYLETRFGVSSYKTGSLFFILSRIVGTASKLYLVIFILQSLVFESMNVPFWLTVSIIVLAIWIYTFRSGMKTILWTDVLQTICIITALVLIISQVASKLGLDLGDIVEVVKTSERSRIFVFDDWRSPQNFVKQFLSGIFIVIVMTGLDQNMMQKNLTCKSLKEAKKNMVSYGFGFIPLNFLFLVLGILLLLFASEYGIQLPEKTDEILPVLASRHLGLPVLICFTIGIVASSFSNADSALTSLTTATCIDLMGTGCMESVKARRVRNVVHLLMALTLLGAVIAIEYIGQSNILDFIYKAVSYTYGPLLGLYFFGLFTNLKIRDKWAPLVCILAPVLSYLFEWWLMTSFGYKVGYEILFFNGVVTALGLWTISKKSTP